LRKHVPTLWPVMALAVLALLIATAGCGAKPTPSPTPTKTPKPTFTPTITKTPTPRWSPTPVWTPTPLPPTATPVPPTATPRPPTATPVPRPPTATPLPLPTSTPSLPYRAAVVRCETNCGTTWIDGTVYQPAPSTEGKSGVLVRIWAYGHIQDTRKTGTDPKGSGYWSFIAKMGSPMEGNWEIAIVDENGNLLSEKVTVHTTGTACNPGEGGCQHGIVDFQGNY
jgi:hypothetical protein